MATVFPLVTKNDVDVIKRYVSTGQGLPTTKEGVLKQFPAGSPSFVTNFVDNYTTIKKHADTWQSVEASMKIVSATLIAFANDMHEYCDGEDGAIEIIENLKGYKTRKLDEMTPEELGDLPEIAFNSDDALTGADSEKLPTLEETVDYIKKSITGKKLSSKAALGTLITFQTALGPIKSWVGQKVEAFKTDERDRELFDKFNALIKFDAELKIENAVAKEKLSVSFENIALVLMGPLGSVLFANKAAKIAGVVEANQKKRTAMLTELESSNVIRAQVMSLHIGLQSLYDVVTSAIRGVEHLHSHWDAVIDLIETSMTRFKAQRDYTTLGKFVGKLKLVSRDWSDIKTHSDYVQGIFRLA